MTSLATSVLWAALASAREEIIIYSQVAAKIVHRGNLPNGNTLQCQN